MTNGYAVYMETKKRHKESTFQRRCPKSAKCKAFKMDEMDIDAMIEAIKEER